MTSAVLGINIRILLTIFPRRDAWHNFFRQHLINIFSTKNLFTRLIWRCLAATIGGICLTISLSFSIPRVMAARHERFRLGCKPVEGNPDMYGIGIRIAAYLQGLMTIFGEAYTSDPKYSAALTSINLCSLWALSIAMWFCKDNIQWRDVDMLHALGDTISHINLGVLLLPSKMFDQDSVFTRLMRWATFCAWESIRHSPAIDIPDGDCNYDIFKWVVWQNTVEKGHQQRVSYKPIITCLIGTFAVLLTLLRIMVYARGFPWDEVGGDVLAVHKLSFWDMCSDILFTYPMGDVMTLIDTVRRHGIDFSGSFPCAGHVYLILRRNPGP